jgi:anthranilate phosphoribosyltransferase
MKTFTSEEITEFSHDVSQITDWIMMAHADHFQIGFYLTTIRINGIDKNPQIVAACAKAMTKHAISVSLDGLQRKDTPVVDIVGTGGDGHDTFNVSTTAAIVASGAGCIVAKVSSQV